MMLIPYDNAIHCTKECRTGVNESTTVSVWSAPGPRRPIGDW